jgi:hypothetical protein
MWETEALGRWSLIVRSHFRGEIAPIRGNAFHYLAIVQQRRDNAIARGAGAGCAPSPGSERLEVGDVS